MNWKNYFHFQKQDQTAILILLFTIVLCGGFYITIRMIQKQNKFDKSAEIIKFTAHIDSINTYAVPYPTKLVNGETIDLNRADTFQLRRIPGIGSVYAKRIVIYRDSVGGFHKLEELKNIKGIKQNLYHKIARYLTLEPKNSFNQLP